ncbi:MAG: serine/threonine-protein kinase [Planctomycetota bacterium]
MDRERWRHVRSVAEAALELPAAQRADFAATRCAGDPALAAEVRRLVCGPTPAGQFLEPPADCAGMRVGAYRLTGLIARGGMASVYHAVRVDEQFDLEVAIKLLPAELDEPGRRERFRRERQALARLEHPHIARLLDGGTSPEGRPFIVMEYVRGVPITQWCQERSATLRQRLELFGQVCAAVHCAHRNLIVHRDLKPENILVDGSGQAKLLDFGIHKHLVPGLADATEAVEGFLTLRYSSPEQLRGEPVSTATDVYSLGIVLHELLSGQVPYGEIDSLQEMVHAACERILPPPSATPRGSVRGIGRELDAIVSRATAKRPDGRYPSAEALQADIARYLRGDAVLAHPPTVRYRVVSTLRRHRWSFAATVAVILALATFALVAVRERARAEAARRVAEGIQTFLRETLEGADPLRAGGENAGLLAMLHAASARLTAAPPEPAVEGPLRLTLGRALLELYRVADAAPHARRAVAALRRTPGNSQALAAALELQADVHLARFDPAAGEAAYRESLELLGGAPATARARAHHRLAAALVQQRRLDAAEPHFAAALALAAAAGDPDQRAEIELAVAGLHAGQGRAERAHALVDQVLQRQCARFTTPSERLAATVESAAGVDLVLGADERAASRFEEAVAMRAQLAGAGHASLVGSTARAGLAHQRAGNRERAGSLLQSAFKVASATLPEWHPDHLLVRGRYAHWLLEQGRHADAEPLLRGSYETQVGLAGEDHPIAQQVRGLLAQLYESWGKPDLAREWR